MLKLDVRAFGLASGIIWGLGMLGLGLINLAGGFGGSIIQLLGTVYVGYKPTVAGSIIGGIWGFLDAGVAGIILAWLYNKFAK